MSRWLLPLVAGAFWLGILAAGLGPTIGAAPSLCLLGAGVLVLALHLRLARHTPAATASIPRAPPYRSVRRSVAVASALLAFALLGAGWSALRTSRLASSPLAERAGSAVMLVGDAVADPATRASGWSLAVRIELLQGLAAPSAPAVRLHDAVWAEGRGPPPPVRAGDRILLEGVLSVPTGDFGTFLRHRGFAAEMAANDVRFLSPPGGILTRPAEALRSALRSSLEHVFPRREAGLLMGLTLGDTSRLDPFVAESFRATGLTHLLAVSGENLAMFLAPLLGLSVLLHAGQRARLAVGLAGTAFFVLLARGEPSVLRAAAMATISMLGVFLGRPREGGTILAGAVLAVLILDPTLVYSIGFQLSVAATFGMVMLATPIADRLGFLPRGLALAAGTTFAAQAGVTPVLLHTFGAVPTVTLLANVLAYPAVGPGMMFGLAAAAAAIVFRPLGLVLAWTARVPLGYLEWVAAHLARSPFPTVTASPGSRWALFGGFAVVAAATWWVARSPRRDVTRRRTARPRVARIAAVPCLIVPLIAWAGLSGRPPAHFTVTFFDVGQGDSALVRSPQGATILIDGGPDPQEVARKLAAVGIHRLDLMVATHPHADHVAGLQAVLARLPVGLVLDPGCTSTSPAYRDFLLAVRSSGAPFRHPRPGTTYRIGDVHIDVLGPDHCASGTASDPNNDSLVLLVTDGRDSVLFPGDAEQPEQTDLVRDEAGLLHAEVLKVPHHGGDTSLAEFLAAVGAGVAVVSVGPNRYGHPVASLLDELAADGMRVFRTDRSGDVTVAFEQGRLTVASSHG